MKLPFQKGDFREVLQKYFRLSNETQTLKPLSELLPLLRQADFSYVLFYLRENPKITENFSNYLHNLFREKPFNLSLTEASILAENSFFSELKKRILDTVLPPVENENTVWYIADHVTAGLSRYYQFFKNLPRKQLDELFRLLKVDDLITRAGVQRDLLFSLNILAWRVIGNALDVEVVRMAPEYRNFDNPFLALQNEMDLLTNQLRGKPETFLSSKDAHYKQIKIYLRQCQQFVDKAFKNSEIYGISGRINQSLMKIRQQLTRMSQILPLMAIDEPSDVLHHSETLFLRILEYKSKKNNIRELVDESSRMISHLITNHTAETGTHYITSSVRDYLGMLWKASGGGMIVGFLCVLKMLYGFLPGSEFSHAFLYSMNYAMGFIMIYLMGYTLATKQPAMTAATMAKVLASKENNERRYVDFAHLVARLFRSQFIAFVGNVLLSFPVALLVIYGFDVLFNVNFASAKADKLLQDLNPVESKSLFHASIAGVFLFISGIIAGNVGNSSVYYRIPRRIAENVLVKNIVGEKTAGRLSKYYAKNWAGIISNFWFGVFLGATGPIGHFLGLDLDIRHITFAAGNFALGLYGKDFTIPVSTFWISFVTVFLIGFFNFIVSFGLSMFLAFRSRKVDVYESGKIFREIFRYFLRRPLLFFLPIKSGIDLRSAEMVEKISTK